MSGDHDFEKFREKKLNEKAASQHEDDAAFFGTFKKKPEEEDGPKKMKLTDLNLPDERRDDVPKVGESVKLIDIALGNAPGAPPAPARPAHPGPRPGQGARPSAAWGPSASGSGPPAPGGPAARPGQPPAKPSAPTARPTPPTAAARGPSAPTARPTPPTTGRPSAPTPRPGAPAHGAAPHDAHRPAPPRPTGAHPGPRPTSPHAGAPRPPAAPPRPGTPPQRSTGAAFRPATRPLAPPTGATPSKPAPPPPGFSDRAHGESERLEPAKNDHFEDTTFVEATEHADPYEFRDQGGSGAEFGETADGSAWGGAPKPSAPGARPGPRPKANDASKSGRLKAVKPQPPAPQPKKATTRRVKRGPLGR